MFQKFLVPELRQILGMGSHGIYHLDGIEQVRHLDLLLGLPQLELIQFVASTRPGDPNSQDPLLFVKEFRRILEAGKKVLVMCPVHQRHNLEPLLNAIPRRGVIICVYSGADELVAEEVLQTLDKIGA